MDKFKPEDYTDDSMNWLLGDFPGQDVAKLRPSQQAVFFEKQALVQSEEIEQVNEIMARLGRLVPQWTDEVIAELKALSPILGTECEQIKVTHIKPFDRVKYEELDREIIELGIKKGYSYYLKAPESNDVAA